MRTAQGAYATMRAGFGLHAGRVERMVGSFRYTEPVYRDNLPLPMRAALDQLRCLRDSVIVRPADMNMGIVVVDADWYNRLCIEYLSDNSKFVLVQQEPGPLLHECALTVAAASKDMRLLDAAAFGDRVAAEDFEYLLHEREFAFPAFYGIVEVNKREPALRPIKACHSWVTTPLARVNVAAHVLHGPMARTFPTFCQTRVHW